MGEPAKVLDFFRDRPAQSTKPAAESPSLTMLIEMVADAKEAERIVRRLKRAGRSLAFRGSNGRRKHLTAAHLQALLSLQCQYNLLQLDEFMDPDSGVHVKYAEGLTDVELLEELIDWCPLEMQVYPGLYRALMQAYRQRILTS